MHSLKFKLCGVLFLCCFDRTYSPPIFGVIEMVQVDAKLSQSQISLRQYAPVKCQYRAVCGIKTQMTRHLSAGCG